MEKDPDIKTHIIIPASVYIIQTGGQRRFRGHGPTTIQARVWRRREWHKKDTLVQGKSEDV
jgi:hypothetical protein